MLEARQLTHRSGRQLVLRQISFTAPDGAVTAVLGPVDSGKTTLLRAVLGLEHPEEGVVLFNGRTLGSYGGDPESPVGAVLKTRWGQVRRTVRDEMTVAATMSGVSSRRAQDALAAVGLATVAGLPVRSLSTGMQRRLGLAIATLSYPKHLVLDEPLQGLGVHDSAWFSAYLTHYAATGRVVLLSTTYIRDVADIAQAVIVLGGGRVLASGSVDEILDPSGTALRP